MKEVGKTWAMGRDRGMTLVELMVVIAVGFVILTATLAFVSEVFTIPTRQLNEGQVMNDAKNQLERMSDLLRGGTNIDWNSNGQADVAQLQEWWLVSGNDNEIIFYTIGGTGGAENLERVRWWMSGETLWQERAAVGSGACFGGGSTEVLSLHLKNEEEQVTLFRYLGADGIQLATPVVMRDKVEQVQMRLVFGVGTGPGKQSTTIRTQITPRKGLLSGSAGGAPACGDCLDNDGDGAADNGGVDIYGIPADPGCWGPSDNDEQDEETACDDGVDNDWDWKSDFRPGGRGDPDCTGPEDDCEGDTSPFQCSNCLDDDSDGVSDVGDDFSCSDPWDWDEANPKAQCQDEITNDNDDLIDMADPACETNQDNAEAGECQDRIDNDHDGARDFGNDFSCDSKIDDDETLPKAQCQDEVDNDNDEATDFGLDFSCSSKQDNDETNPKSECQDEIDNDSDLATDYANDFSCTTRQDNDETFDLAACQNEVDDEGDGLTDANDPGCRVEANESETYNAQDNSEYWGSECDDGIDNDGDGAMDFAIDFSCGGRLTHGTEENPKAQCQDGSDNDWDWATDMQDWSCANKQDNDEGDRLAQCQDRVDNDGDGQTDFGSDTGCISYQDNEEKGECQDGLDNDSDGATDYPNDFSCSENNDTDETNPKSQCQDGVDNDGDIEFDYGADQSCSTRQDNDERDPLSQCQDNLDNDSDGSMDYPSDYSCTNYQDNDETNLITQCQDGNDNDGDGLRDLMDPECNGAQDNSESPCAIFYDLQPGQLFDGQLRTTSCQTINGMPSGSYADFWRFYGNAGEVIQARVAMWSNPWVKMYLLDPTGNIIYEAGGCEFGWNDSKCIPDGIMYPGFGGGVFTLPSSGYFQLVITTEYRTTYQTSYNVLLDLQ